MRKDQAAFEEAGRGRKSRLTISASSLVERAILAAAGAGRGPRIVCLESRPALEGVALAGRLAAAGLRVTLVTDAAGPLMTSVTAANTTSRAAMMYWTSGPARSMYSVST